MKTIALKDLVIRRPSEMIALGDANLAAYVQFILVAQGSGYNLSASGESGEGELSYFKGKSIVGPAASSDKLLKNCRRSTRQRHRDRFNLGFADGHIESMKTERLFSNRPDIRKLWSNDNEPHPELP